MSKYAFVNPYNFIPLQTKAPERNTVTKGRYSGVIEYSLLTKTPLFIPNTSSADAFRMNIPEHKSYDFFSYKDLSEETDSAEKKYYKPVIPGSSVRGVLRSNFEILTNSCMSAIDDDDVLSKRTNETFKQGLLKKEGENYRLYTAEDHLLRTMGENDLRDDPHWKDDPAHNNRKCYRQKDLQEGQKVYFIKKARTSTAPNGKSFPVKSLALQVSDQAGTGKTVGYVLKGEDGPNLNGAKQQKHACHIFSLQGEFKQLEKEETATMDKVLKAYRDNAQNEYREYASAWKRFRNGEGEEYFPVYYSTAQGKAGDFVMLSPACITREIYRNKISDMIPQHRSCDKKDALCPACRLFGTLGRQFQVTSRIRVTDLILDDENEKSWQTDPAQLFEQVTTLDPLGAPKINNMEFYLKRPSEDAWFWTYDYYITKDGKVVSMVPMINGRKFYWHQNSVAPQAKEANSLNTTVRPLKAGVTFRGKIYFEDISKEELDELCYVIETGESGKLTDKKHGYKLGHAKPLGYGSVALQVDRVLLKKAALDTENATVVFSENEYEEKEMPAFEEAILRDFRKYTDFELLKEEDVHYPRPQKADKDGNYPIFAWFAENHRGYDRRKGKTVKMPNSRQQMVFAEYMEAMEPGLKPTGIPGGNEYTGGRVAAGNNVQSGEKNVSRGDLNEEGKVKTIVSDKGFAFLTTEKGDLFVHRKAFAPGEFERLSVGASVCFKRGIGPNGKEQAAKAQLL